MTNRDLQHELASNGTNQLQNITRNTKKNNVYFFIALEESTDSTVFEHKYYISFVQGKFQLFGELIAFGMLKGCTRETGNNLKEKCHKVGLNLTKLFIVSTDCDPTLMV